MRLGFWRLLSLSLICILLLAGCGKELVTGRQVSNPKKSNAIISLSPSTTEIIGRHGNFERLIGKTERCNWPPIIKQLPVVGSEKPNYEAIVMLKPDVIVYDDDLYNDADKVKLQELGIDLYPFGADTIDGFIEELQKLGMRLAMESKLAEYAEKIYAARARGQGDARTPRIKVALIMGDYIAGKNSLYADEVRAGGGEAVGPESTKWEPINAEALTQWNPDVLLVASEDMFTRYEFEAPDDAVKAERQDEVLIKYVPSEVMKDPKLQALNAIKNRKVASIRMDAIARRGGRVDVVIDAVRTYLAGMP